MPASSMPSCLQPHLVDIYLICVMVCLYLSLYFTGVFTGACISQERVPGLRYGMHTAWKEDESDFEVVVLRRWRSGGGPTRSGPSGSEPLLLHSSEDAIGGRHGKHAGMAGAVDGVVRHSEARAGGDQSCGAD